MWYYFLIISVVASIFVSCSNSESIAYSTEEIGAVNCKDINVISKLEKDSLWADSAINRLSITEPANIDSIETDEKNYDTIKDYLPIDDTEYPYAGIPRIVIETENYRPIKDCETEIPAKMQIWGDTKPESEIMELTIRGRGNTSWNMPKKSYKIEFVDKQPILGMPKDRDWALVSNYADKSLMKNYLMYHLSVKLESYYAPRCEFVEFFLNGKYLGVYLLTETIKIAKNRVNIPEDEKSYIVEFDGKYNKGEQVFFFYAIKNDSVGRAFRVHAPKNADTETLKKIETYIKDFENYLKRIDSKEDNRLEQWINVDEYIKHYWIQEFSKNHDAVFYTSVFFSWEKDDVLKMGPVWDFDLSLGEHDNEYVNKTRKWLIRDSYWNEFVFKDPKMSEKRKWFWKNKKNDFQTVIDMVDSIGILLKDAASNNFKKWDVLQSTKYAYHQHSYSTYKDAVEDLKNWIRERIEWIDENIEL